MTIPNLKRVKVASEQELENWLVQHPDQDDEIMVVTHNKTSADKHVSREQVAEALAAHGWISGTRYTLNGTLIGHVIRKDNV